MIALIIFTFLIFALLASLILYTPNRKNLYGNIIKISLLAIVGLFVLGFIFGQLFTKKILRRDDFIGEYVIDRSYFKGHQADWQYNHYRFEIKDNDSINFYCTDKENIIKTFKGKISVLTNYKSNRLSIAMEEPTHHILNSNPTIYRQAWSFILVFNSSKFNNLYFKKGNWKPIN